MAHLDPKSNQSLSNINKALRGGQGYKVVNQIIANQNTRKRLLKHMGVPMAEVGKIREHIAEETHQLGRDLKSKKQILQHFRGKWGLSDTNSKKLLQAIAPGKTGPSKKDLEKIKEKNLRMKFIVDVIGSKRVSARSGQSAGDKRKEAAEEKKQEMLAPRVPGYHSGTAEGPAEKSMGNLVVGPWGGKAEELTRSGDLEVKHIEGGTGLAGGKPTGAGLAGGKLEEGVASVIDLNKKREEKKSAENKKTGSKPDLQLAA